MKEYALKTDVVVLMLHIATTDAQTNTTWQELRKQFNKYNYSVPIIVQTAHTHLNKHQPCIFSNGSKDNNCYVTEAGCYLEVITHMFYTFKPLTYTYNNTQHNGYSMLSHYNYANETNAVDILAKRFNLTSANFDTANGIAIRKTIKQWSSDLGLSKQLGCATKTYTLTPTSNNDSFFKLYID